MVERSKRTVEIWDRCECGKTLHSISEGVRGTCSTCWFKTIPSDTKKSLNRLIAAAFNGSTDAEKDAAIKDALQKFDRDNPETTKCN